MIGSPALLARIEGIAVRGRRERWERIPDELARRVRPSVTPVADGLLTLMRGSDSLWLNRVIGLGHRGRARPAVLDEIVARVREAGVRRFALHLGPGPQAGRIARWARARGFVRGRGHVLLLRDLRVPIPALPDAPRVVRARGRQRAIALDILDRTFGNPPSQRSWSRATAALPGWEYFLAFVGRSPAGMGVLRTARDLAWLAGGATLTRWRRRGAQSALIAARLRRAARLGCRWAWSETLEPERGRPDASQRNLLRMGFVEACRKPLLVWRA